METEKEALEKTKALWLEMAMEGYLRKADYFKKIGEKDKYWLDCPLCELYAKGRKGKSNQCQSCPFQAFGEFEGCLNEPSPYRLWVAHRYSSRAKDRGYYAIKVYNFLAKVYREHYRGKRGGNRWN